MTPEQIDRVFGHGRLKMVTGEHVEVFREAVAPGERRRYTKRFLNTSEADFGQWTEREWRILARLIGHGIACVPDVVQFDRGHVGGAQIVQTYDAGVTVDQWATLLPVARDGRVHRHVFEDCAHWWALAHHCLLALDAIHPLELVHLDIKGDNVCIPYTPVDFDPNSSDLRLQPVFAQLALIDFAFALISRERLTTPLPLGRQEEYDYQSPRLLAALEEGRNGELQRTRELDWRCDMYSLAAMLQRYLPDDRERTEASGWTREHRHGAKALISELRTYHDRELPAQRPHATLIEATAARLREREMALSLARGWTLAREARIEAAPVSLLTPVTRVAPVTRVVTPARVARSGRVTAVTVVAPAARERVTAAARPQRSRAPALLTLVVVATVAAALWNARVDMMTKIQALSESLSTAANEVTQSPSAPAEKLNEAAGGEPHSAPPQLAGDRKGSVPVPAPEPAPAAASASSSRPAPAMPIAQSAPSPRPATRAPELSSARAPDPAPAIVAEAIPARKTAPPASAPLASPPVNEVKNGPPANESASAGASSPKTPSSNRAVEKHEASPARRSYASWAVLEPPAWLRSGKPPNPPGPASPEARSEPAAGADATRAKAAATTANVRRPRASWASLEPPSWLRTGNPPPVPGTATQESSASPTAAQETTLATAAPSPSVAAPATPSLPDAARAVNRPLPHAVMRAPMPGGADAAVAPIEDRNPAAALAPPPSGGSALANRIAVTPFDQRADDDFATQGRRMLYDHVPRLARLAEPDVARVLRAAAGANLRDQDRAVASVARVAWKRNDTFLLTRTTAPTEARRLNDRARAARASRRMDEALDLQLQAFGANPRDAEIAADFAALYLELSPPEPERARELALFALATRGDYLPSAWAGGWNALAAANAFGGRTADARNALFVALAISDDVENACVSALRAYANYGERMRAPVEAMLYRAHTQGRDQMFPACAWPPPPPPQLIAVRPR